MYCIIVDLGALRVVPQRARQGYDALREARAGGVARLLEEGSNNDNNNNDNDNNDNDNDNNDDNNNDNNDNNNNVKLMILIYIYIYIYISLKRVTAPFAAATPSSY